MFYIEKDEKIVLFDEDREKLVNTLVFMPQYKGLEIKEVPKNYTIFNFELLTLDGAKEKEKQKEQERLDMLSLTRADVERALYKAKGIDFEDVLELVRDRDDIDLKALKIELKANNFYRGNPYINQIGELLGYSSDELDYLFLNKRFDNEGINDNKEIV